MTYCPDMSRAFYNALNSKKNSDQLTQELENMTIMDSNMVETQKDNPSKKFVLKERTYNGYKLLQVKPSFVPKWTYTPTVDVVIKDKEEGNGAIIYYKLDIEKTVFSFITVWGITIMAIVGMIWLACATCVSFDFVGIIISLLLIVGPGYIAYRSICIPLKKAADKLRGIA